jgi:hypothetical protein
MNASISAASVGPACWGVERSLSLPDAATGFATDNSNVVNNISMVKKCFAFIVLSPFSANLFPAF